MKLFFSFPRASLLPLSAYKQLDELRISDLDNPVHRNIARQVHEAGGTVGLCRTEGGELRQDVVAIFPVEHVAVEE